MKFRATGRKIRITKVEGEPPGIHPCHHHAYASLSFTKPQDSLHIGRRQGKQHIIGECAERRFTLDKSVAASTPTQLPQGNRC